MDKATPCRADSHRCVTWTNFSRLSRYRSLYALACGRTVLDEEGMSDQVIDVDALPLEAVDEDPAVQHDDEREDGGIDDPATAEAYDELYLETKAGAKEEAVKNHTENPKVLHETGNSKLQRW